MEIKKVKLRDGMFAYVEYSQTAGEANDQFQRTCNNPVHNDFKEKLQHLAVHAALITELIDPSKVKGDVEKFQHPILEKIIVKSISLGGDEGEGLTISFERKLSTGKILNLNTPFTKYYEDTRGYRFGDDLQLAVNDFIEEVEAYLKGDKYGEGTQLSLGLNDNNSDDSPL
jgi:hypothetical protein